jgi:hypothetical protein
MPRRGAPLAARLAALRLGRTHTECWEWEGARTSDGYGWVKVDGHQTRAHRVGYQMFHGTVDPALVVCHSCDNRLCVNPAHLWLGTRLQNMHDKARKGRLRTASGAHPKWQVCCGGCKWWTADAVGSTSGRCTVPIPFWVQSQHRATNDQQGTQCESWISLNRKALPQPRSGST